MQGKTGLKMYFFLLKFCIEKIYIHIHTVHTYIHIYKRKSGGKAYKKAIKFRIRLYFLIDIRIDKNILLNYVNS